MATEVNIFAEMSGHFPAMVFGLIKHVIDKISGEIVCRRVIELVRLLQTR